MSRRVRGLALGVALVGATLPARVAASLDDAGGLGAVAAGVDDPGQVFGVLAEGVAAYAAKVAQQTGMGTDKWGNPMGPGYVKAQRPDTVSTELRNFLMEYYKDKPGFVVRGTAAEAQAVLIQRAADRAAAAAREKEAREKAERERQRPPGAPPGVTDPANPGGPTITAPPRPGDPSPPPGSAPGPEVPPDLSSPNSTAAHLRERYGVFVDETASPPLDARALGLIEKVLAGVPRYMYEYPGDPNSQHLTFSRQAGGNVGSHGLSSKETNRIVLHDGSFNPPPDEYPRVPEDKRKDAWAIRSIATLVAKVGLEQSPDDGKPIDGNTNRLVNEWRVEVAQGWAQGSGGVWIGKGSNLLADPGTPFDELATVIGWYCSDVYTLQVANNKAYQFLKTRGFQEPPKLERTTPPPTQ